ncbi:MAG TPA: serine/threonine-protein kinase [Longimicrobium sp.]|nr:serine/threonine-protein kinase [Longimicrobium sp.]
MTQPFERLMVGRTLAGRYELLQPIGWGGMSFVFRGRDGTLGREVAVKVVSLVAAGDQVGNLRERFRREAASAARIQHPNVVQSFDYGTDPELELDFIVMELLRGRDLKQALHAAPLATADALRILRQAALGVAAGHRAGIIHRDVKPANVFLLGGDGAEGVRILDFGIAKPLEDDGADGLTTIGHLPHSPAYASPEQLDPETPLSAASDVYQLGLIGYEMLAGRRPFDEQERALIRGGAAIPLPTSDAWSRLPSGVCGVIERALSPRPEQRFADADAFADALAAAEAEDATAFHAGAAAPSPGHDHTELLVPEGVPVVVSARPPAPEAPAPAPGPPPEPAPQLTTAARAAATPAPRQRSRMLWLAPLLLLVGIAVFALSRRGGGGDDPGTAQAAEPAVPDSAGLAALDEEFVRLQGAVGSQAPARPAPVDSAPQGARPAAQAPAPPAAAPADGDVLAQARREIEVAVRELNRAWTAGEMDEHVAHYASRVDYYNSERLPRAGVRRDRTRDLRRYDDRRIGIHSIQVEFLEPDRARALVDKQWYFGGDGRVRQGRGMQEYVFKRDEDDGRWYVVSEQLLTTTEARSTLPKG